MSKARKSAGLKEGEKSRNFYLESENVIRENDNLIPTILMILNQKLTRLKLLRVHTIEQHFLPRFLPQVFTVKLGSHVAPYFCTLNFCDVSILGEVHPVRFVEFGSDQEVQIVNLVIFSNEGGCTRIDHSSQPSQSLSSLSFE